MIALCALGRAVARVHRQVGHDLVVARARRVQAPADRPDDLRQAPLDRHVDVFVLRLERERAPRRELLRDLVEPREQRVAILRRDDPARGQHARVRARLRDVLRPQPPIELDRVVQALEVGVLGLVEARHARSVYGGRARLQHRGEPLGHARTWPSLISGKNGSASERAATSSQTGNSPSRCPKRSR